MMPSLSPLHKRPDTLADLLVVSDDPTIDRVIGPRQVGIRLEVVADLDTFCSTLDGHESTLMLLDLRNRISLPTACFADSSVLGLCCDHAQGGRFIEQGLGAYLTEDELNANDLRAAIFRALEHAKTVQAYARSNNDLARLSSIVNMSPVTVFTWATPDGRSMVFENISKNISQFGYDRDEFLSGAVRWQDVVHPDDRPRVRRTVLACARSDASTFTVVYRFLSRDGTVHWVEDRSIVERDVKGRIKYFHGFLIDISEHKRAETELSKREAQLRSLLDGMPTPTVIAQIENGTVLYANQAVKDLFAVQSAEDVDADALYADPYERERLRQLFRSEGKISDREVLWRRPDGSTFWALFSSTPVTLDGKVAMLTTFQNINHLKQVEAALHEQSANLERLHDKTKSDLKRTQTLYAVGQILSQPGNPDDLLRESAAELRRSLSARVVAILRVDPESLVPEATAFVTENDMPFPKLDPSLYEGTLFAWSMRHKQAALSRKNQTDERESPAVGAYRAEMGLGSIITSPLIYQGEVLGTVFAFGGPDAEDFDEDDLSLLQASGHQIAAALHQRELMARIEHQAYHDALTGLPNRLLFENRLEHLIAQSQRAPRKNALLFIDLDGFKHINDTLGHYIGDALLIEVANRLKKHIRQSDTLARMGGDEFAVLLGDVRHATDAVRVARKLLTLFKSPFSVGEQELFVGASIGVSTYPNDGTDAASLLKNADSAMYQAKARGKNGVESFTRELAEQATLRLGLENDLRHAVERGELELFYQPQIDLASGDRVGLEALLRWRRDGRFVSPMDFIPIAEESGLILPIGDWVLTQACQQAADWQRQGHAPLRMAVNISARQFDQDSFVDTLRHALEASGLAPEWLELEVTESLVMQDVTVVAERLAEVRALGVRVAIDDFGTGYSSLKYLKSLPLDTLKIDRAFVNAMLDSDADASLVATIIMLARNFRLNVVAEGIETLDQLEALRGEGCNEAQGYYFAKPLPAGEVWSDS